MNIPRAANDKGFSEKLRSLKVDGEPVFLRTSAQSAHAIAHRLGLQGKIKVRSFKSGVKVWRVNQ